MKMMIMMMMMIMIMKMKMIKMNIALPQLIVKLVPSDFEWK